MKTKIAINGFGRIGRLVFRAIHQRHQDSLEIVAVNGPADIKTNAHLLKWDSTYGRSHCEVDVAEDAMIVDGRRIGMFMERDATKISWTKFGAEIVIDCTGSYTDGKKAVEHLQSGAKKVIISSPAKNEDITVVLGVNEKDYIPSKHNIISNASCTTNCVAPLAKVLHQNFGIVKGLMNTIHSYTNDQQVLDHSHRDLRRARTAGVNIIPTTTGAAKLVGSLIPDLKGKVDGISVRVPTVTVSVVDFVAVLSKNVTAEQVTEAFRKAADGELAGIMEYCEEELVSSDFKGNSASCIIDAKSTMVLQDNMVRVFAWYDNEWGYSCRLGDITTYVAGKGL